MSVRAWVFTGVGLGLLALLLVGLASQLRWHSEVVNLGYQGEAQRNPYYLAERWLMALGREADGARLLPPSHRLRAADVLVMNTPSHRLTGTQSDALLAWVAAGGHLITGVWEAYQPGAGMDALLDSLGVQVSDDAEGGSRKAAQISAQQLGKAVHFDTELRLHSSDERVLVRLDYGHGALLLQLGIEQGLITLLTDLSMFHNDNLPVADHGAFLWELVGTDESTGKIWLQYSQQVPSLMAVLVERAWMPLLGASLALAAWLWQSTRRFGPVLTSPPLGRRSLVEHLHASGRFFRQRRLTGVLLGAARRRGQQRLMQRIPDWQQLTKHQRAERAAQLSRLPVAHIQHALDNPQPEDFLATMKTLKQLASL